MFTILSTSDAEESRIDTRIDDAVVLVPPNLPPVLSNDEQMTDATSSTTAMPSPVRVDSRSSRTSSVCATSRRGRSIRNGSCV